EDEVLKISTSVFVTNFPDQYSAKDLWNTCKQYGYVVDVFIPNRRSKSGKRFGFVRFIKIFDVERLVNNLCTIQQATNDFTVEGRVAWVEIEGIPLNMWSENTFKRIASKWRNLIHVDDQDDDLEGESDLEVVLDTKLDEEPLNTNVEEASVGQKEARSEDPFNIYELLNKKKENNNKESNLDDGLMYPPGFTTRNDNAGSEEHSNRCTCECFHTIQEEDAVFRSKNSCSKENFMDD
nr:ChaC-like family protein [Tanacetum cinerariifolium]